MIPVYNIGIFIQTFAAAIIAGLIGGLYPVWRINRLSPTETLRYE